MAQSFSLAYYLITLNVRNTRNLAVLSDFKDGQDYLDVVDLVVSTWKYKSDHVNIENDAKNKRVFRIKKDENGNDMYYREGRFLSGMIESGDYGSEEPVVNVNTGEPTHTKTTSESLLKPFYFLFYIPKNSVRGFLILERIGTAGIYTILNDALLNYYRDGELLDLSLKIMPLMSDEANKKYRQMIDYEASQVVLHKVRKQDVNISKMTDNNIEDQEISYIDIAYHAPVGKKISVGRWINMLKKDEKGLFGVEETGKYDDVDFVVEINGKPKKLSAKGIDKLGTVFDITEAVSKNIVKGYPSFAAIKKEAMDVISDLNKQFGISQ